MQLTRVVVELSSDCSAGLPDQFQSILRPKMTVNFTPGDLVKARGREWVALPTPGDGLLALRPFWQ